MQLGCDMTPISQKHSDAPSWAIQQFPVRLRNHIKAHAAMAGQTITEYLVEKLNAVAESREVHPDYVSPFAGDETLDLWVIKHFPEDLRLRLRDMAEDEQEPLYKWAVREMSWTVEMCGR